MIRSRQLLPCPEDCPSRMYAFMVECWHEVIITVMMEDFDGDDGDHGEDESDGDDDDHDIMIGPISRFSTSQVPTRRPAFPEIHQRLRQWEGLGGR